jgi:hypothetical protein
MASAHNAPSPTLRPDDIRDTARLCREALAPALEADWNAPAGTLTWTCRRTLDHIGDALCLYAAHLAARAQERLPIARDGTPTLGVADLLRLVEPLAAILAAVAEAAPAGTRAFHPAGMADVSGFVAMGCDEMLIHSADIAAGLGLPFRPPDVLIGQVLARLFPWAPGGEDVWATLLWANGRAELSGYPRLEADWYWWCAPLEEWDGTRKRRTAPPAWS